MLKAHCDQCGKVTKLPGSERAGDSGACRCDLDKTFKLGGLPPHEFHIVRELVAASDQNLLRVIGTRLTREFDQHTVELVRERMQRPFWRCEECGEENWSKPMPQNRAKFYAANSPAVCGRCGSAAMMPVGF